MAHKFYSDLYSKREIDKAAALEIASQCTKITRDQSLGMERNIEFVEFEEIICSFKLDKALGPDGLTPYFYFTFFEMLAPEFIKLMEFVIFEYPQMQPFF